MRKFKITVNGEVYEVEVEELTEESAQKAAPSKVEVPVASRPVQQKVQPKTTRPAQQPAAKKPVAAGEGSITAPIPGVVLDIKVSEGQSVSTGDVLLILEAMKMENEIVAPNDGVVKQIAVSKGANVNTGDVLIILG